MFGELFSSALRHTIPEIETWVLSDHTYLRSCFLSEGIKNHCIIIEPLFSRQRSYQTTKLSEYLAAEKDLRGHKTLIGRQADHAILG